MRRRDVAKERFWREAARRQWASGLSVRAFCRREKQSEAALYSWRRTMQERDVAAPGRPIRGPVAPARRSAPASQRLRDAAAKPARRVRPAKRVKRSASPKQRGIRPPAFVPAVVTGEPSPDAAISLELTVGRVLRLSASIPAERLAELVLALEARAAR